MKVIATLLAVLCFLSCDQRVVESIDIELYLTGPASASGLELPPEMKSLIQYYECEDTVFVPTLKLYRMDLPRSFVGVIKVESKLDTKIKKWIGLYEEEELKKDYERGLERLKLPDSANVAADSIVGVQSLLRQMPKNGFFLYSNNRLVRLMYPNYSETNINVIRESINKRQCATSQIMVYKIIINPRIDFEDSIAFASRFADNSLAEFKLWVAEESPGFDTISKVLRGFENSYAIDYRFVLEQIRGDERVSGFSNHQIEFSLLIRACHKAIKAEEENYPQGVDSLVQDLTANADSHSGFFKLSTHETWDQIVLALEGRSEESLRRIEYSLPQLKSHVH
jgi:hypothetical protein